MVQDPEFYNVGGVASPMPKQFTLTVKLWTLKLYEDESQKNIIIYLPVAALALSTNVV